MEAFNVMTNLEIFSLGFTIFSKKNLTILVSCLAILKVFRQLTSHGKYIVKLDIIQ